jgi:hypothetical protein
VNILLALRTGATVGNFVLGQRRRKAPCGRGFLAGLRGELGSHCFDGGKAQLGEEEFDMAALVGSVVSCQTSIEHESGVGLVNGGEFLVGGGRLASRFLLSAESRRRWRKRDAGTADRDRPDLRGPLASCAAHG